MKSAGSHRQSGLNDEGGKAKSKKSPHVGGQLYGYSLQTTRATARLLQSSPGSYVTVEVFDDVGVENGEGQRTAEQTKSGVTQNPIADRSVELWKTMCNWLDAVEQGHIEVDKTVFELYVSTKRRGAIAESFAKAGSPELATIEIRKAKDLFWGTAPSHAKRKNVAATLAPHLDRLFAADETIVASIVARFSLSFGQGDSIDELEALVANKIVSSEMRSTVVHQMLGWTKAAFDRLLARGKPAVIASDEFLRELTSFVQKYDRNKILYSFAPLPPADVAAAELPVRTYVRQLDLIELDYDEKLRAANDYLRASLDRSIWAEKGLVHPSSFDEFGEELERAWAAKKMSVGVQAAGKPHVDVGRLLYAECLQVKQDLQATAVPSHFTPGCFHALAEDQKVGWHPGYKAALAKGSGLAIVAAT
jgi:hypothetical protein